MELKTYNQQLVNLNSKNSIEEPINNQLFPFISSNTRSLPARSIKKQFHFISLIFWLPLRELREIIFI